MMREIGEGVLVEPISPAFKHWGICKIIERTTNGCVLVEEINHQSSKRFPIEGTKIRHFVNPAKLKFIKGRDKIDDR